MAKLSGNIKFRGTIDNLCFYQMHGKSFLRMKSSLTGKRVRSDPKFRPLMEHAKILSRASTIASFAYQALPKEFRKLWMFRAFTGEATQLLKAGKMDKEAKDILWKTYAEVWELKKASQLQPTGDIPPTATLPAQPSKKFTYFIESLFSIPWKKDMGKIKDGNAGRRVLRRRFVA